MISCSECRQRMFPDDPSIRTGKYHLSDCDHYCNKPIQERELEVREVPHSIFQLDRESKKRIDQLEARLIWVDTKVNKRNDKKKVAEEPF